MSETMSETVIYIRPALCKNKGCNRPVHSKAVAAYAADRALSHETVSLDWCLSCNAEYLRKARAERSGGGLIACVPDDYYDEQRTSWPKGSY